MPNMRLRLLRGLTAVVLAGLALTVAGLVGCGSDGTNPPPVGGEGRLTGVLGSQAAGATVQLDGTGYRTNANARGEFALAGVPPGEYTVSVTTPDRRGGTALVRVSADGTTTMGPVPLDAVGQIAGLITSPTNSGGYRPVAGARVVAMLVPDYFEYGDAMPPGVADGIGAGGGGGVPDRQNDDRPRGEPQPPRVAVTDAAGSFLIPGAAPGPYAVEVTADGYETGVSGTWVSPASTATADVQMVFIDPDNANLSGRVVDEAGQPLAHVRVDLFPQFDLPPPDQPVPVRAVDEDDEEPGEGEVVDTSMPGRPPPPNYDDVKDIDPWYRPPFWQVKSALTDAQGNYQITNIVPGDYQLIFQRWGYDVVMRDLTLTARQNAVQNADLQGNLTTVSGVVYGRQADGSVVPLEGAWVGSTGRWDWNGPVPPVEGGDDGMGGGHGGSGEPGRPGGIVVITHRSRQADDDKDGDGGDEGDGDVEDDPSDGEPYQTVGGGIGGGHVGNSGLVLAPADSPVFDDMVGPRTVVTDAQGRFTLEVEAGHQALFAYAEGYFDAWVEIDVPASGADEVMLILEPWDERWWDDDGRPEDPPMD